MRKLILHIGCEKTGSTSIQNFFHANRRRLMDSYGILYPKTLGGRNHTRVGIYACNEDKDLGRFLPKGKNLCEFRESLENEFRREVMASPASTFIVSNEWLHPRIQETEEFERLQKLFEGLFDEIRIIFYIRRQDKLALSLYSTALKAGNTKKFSFPPGSPDSLPYYYDFYRIYTNWAAHFGEDSIIVKVFERDRLTDGDVVKDFLSTLGISGDNFYYPPEENLSLSNTGAKAMRAFNRVSGRLGHLLSEKKIRKFRDVISRSFQGKPKLASEAECQNFFELFSESNRLLKYRLEDRFKKTFELFKNESAANLISGQGTKVVRLGFINDPSFLVVGVKETVVNIYPLALKSSLQEVNQSLLSTFEEVNKLISDEDIISGSSEWLYIDVRANSDKLPYDERFDHILAHSVMRFVNYFRRHPNFRKKYFTDSSGFYNSLREWDNKLYVRYGIVELRALYSFLFRKEHLPATFERIRANISDEKFMCSDRFSGGFLSSSDTEFNIKRLWVNAGFYSSKVSAKNNYDDFDAWAKNYLEGIKNADSLFRCPGSYVNFLPIEFFMRDTFGGFKQYISPLKPERFYEMIEGRKVLLVSPFAEQLTDSFESGKMRNLYCDIDVPEFEFKAIRAPITIYPNRSGDGWVDSFRSLQEKIVQCREQYDFDLFFASAGCYGIPLCNFVFKEFGTASVYMGNQINTLLGVQQKTNEDFMAGRKRLENWVPSDLASVPGMSRIDKGRYI